MCKIQDRKAMMAPGPVRLEVELRSPLIGDEPHTALTGVFLSCTSAAPQYFPNRLRQAPSQSVHDAHPKPTLLPGTIFAPLTVQKNSDARTIPHQIRISSEVGGGARSSEENTEWRQELRRMVMPPSPACFSNKVCSYDLRMVFSGIAHVTSTCRTMINTVRNSPVETRPMVSQCSAPWQRASSVLHSTTAAAHAPWPFIMEKQPLPFLLVPINGSWISRQRLSMTDRCHIPRLRPREMRAARRSSVGIGTHAPSAARTRPIRPSPLSKILEPCLILSEAVTSRNVCRLFQHALSFEVLLTLFRRPLSNNLKQPLMMDHDHHPLAEACRVCSRWSDIFRSSERFAQISFLYLATSFIFSIFVILSNRDIFLLQPHPIPPLCGGVQRIEKFRFYFEVLCIATRGGVSSKIAERRLPLESVGRDGCHITMAQDEIVDELRSGNARYFVEEVCKKKRSKQQPGGLLLGGTCDTSLKGLFSPPFQTPRCPQVYHSTTVSKIKALSHKCFTPGLACAPRNNSMRTGSASHPSLGAETHFHLPTKIPKPSVKILPSCPSLPSERSTYNASLKATRCSSYSFRLHFRDTSAGKQFRRHKYRAKRFGRPMYASNNLLRGIVMRLTMPKRCTWAAPNLGDIGAAVTMEAPFACLAVVRVRVGVLLEPVAGRLEKMIRFLLNTGRYFKEVLAMENLEVEAWFERGIALQNKLSAYWRLQQREWWENTTTYSSLFMRRTLVVVRNLIGQSQTASIHIAFISCSSHPKSPKNLSEQSFKLLLLAILGFRSLCSTVQFLVRFWIPPLKDGNIKFSLSTNPNTDTYSTLSTAPLFNSPYQSLSQETTRRGEHTIMPHTPSFLRPTISKSTTTWTCIGATEPLTNSMSIGNRSLLSFSKQQLIAFLASASHSDAQRWLDHRTNPTSDTGFLSRKRVGSHTHAHASLTIQTSICSAQLWRFLSASTRPASSHPINNMILKALAVPIHFDINPYHLFTSISPSITSTAHISATYIFPRPHQTSTNLKMRLTAPLLLLLPALTTALPKTLHDTNVQSLPGTTDPTPSPNENTNPFDDVSLATTTNTDKRKCGNCKSLSFCTFSQLPFSPTLRELWHSLLGQKEWSGEAIRRMLFSTF
ncbi:uncharacterized protein BDR25DRAFT_359614 [Lindgomyces ingoldianus]|uniref:Uncharacterized protein n=1 Tax=Lindgomyces ingoldianus TaxID=673940 RepID=A0ACB6QGX8_9PLEO|nr:uncharacterized protein BDR25DRAFT_359614 [Lindgomyces ingoldianus]KAF2466249.1 hypothetical protein BDR25DRAFT_359614 [Lindgomyces ingoldianus]